MSRPVKSKCSACQRVFSSITAFDLHRVGSYAPQIRRRCLTVQEMLAEGLKQDDRGWWTIGPTGAKRPEQGQQRAERRPIHEQ